VCAPYSGDPVMTPIIQQIPMVFCVQSVTFESLLMTQCCASYVVCQQGGDVPDVVFGQRMATRAVRVIRIQRHVR